ncbi:hypothetical protein [Crocosphaera sp.]|uniref:hypothetical protein n=1 Tax=Crocosphaera sp. TaxID=2729996 RepID=UPI00261FD24C|nr:hypothetical protein [Crocosphaera sp.]MDJ0579037.1 hypothetical protein [Crocosphaera sp.]
MVDKFKPKDTELPFFRQLYNLAETGQEDIEPAQKDWKKKQRQYDGLIDPEIREDD